MKAPLALIFVAASLAAVPSALAQTSIVFDSLTGSLGISDGGYFAGGLNGPLNPVGDSIALAFSDEPGFLNAYTTSLYSTVATTLNLTLLIYQDSTKAGGPLFISTSDSIAIAENAQVTPNVWVGSTFILPESFYYELSVNGPDVGSVYIGIRDGTDNTSPLVGTDLTDPSWTPALQLTTVTIPEASSLVVSLAAFGLFAGFRRRL